MAVSPAPTITWRSKLPVLMANPPFSVALSHGLEPRVALADRDRKRRSASPRQSSRWRRASTAQIGHPGLREAVLTRQTAELVGRRVDLRSPHNEIGTLWSNQMRSRPHAMLASPRRRPDIDHRAK